MISTAGDAGAWIAGGSALAVGITAGWVQLRSVKRQQKTESTNNVIAGYDKLVDDLHLEVATARQEAREAREDANMARHQASEARQLFQDCELRSHTLAMTIKKLEQGLEDLRQEVQQHHPLGKAHDRTPSLWEGDNLQ